MRKRIAKIEIKLLRLSRQIFFKHIFYEKRYFQSLLTLEYCILLLYTKMSRVGNIIAIFLGCLAFLFQVIEYVAMFSNYFVKFGEFCLYRSTNISTSIFLLIMYNFEIFLGLPSRLLKGILLLEIIGNTLLLIPFFLIEFFSLSVQLHLASTNLLLDFLADSLLLITSTALTYIKNLYFHITLITINTLIYIFRRLEYQDSYENYFKALSEFLAICCCTYYTIRTTDLTITEKFKVFVEYLAITITCLAVCTFFRNKLIKCKPEKNLSKCLELHLTQELILEYNKVVGTLCEQDELFYKIMLQWKLFIESQDIGELDEIVTTKLAQRLKQRHNSHLLSVLNYYINGEYNNHIDRDIVTNGTFSYSFAESKRICDLSQEFINLCDNGPEKGQSPELLYHLYEVVKKLKKYEHSTQFQAANSALCMMVAHRGQEEIYKEYAKINLSGYCQVADELQTRFPTELTSELATKLPYQYVGKYFEESKTHMTIMIILNVVACAVMLAVCLSKFWRVRSVQRVFKNENTLEIFNFLEGEEHEYDNYAFLKIANQLKLYHFDKFYEFQEQEEINDGITFFALPESYQFNSTELAKRFYMENLKNEMLQYHARQEMLLQLQDGVWRSEVLSLVILGSAVVTLLVHVILHYKRTELELQSVETKEFGMPLTFLRSKGAISVILVITSFLVVTLSNFGYNQTKNSMGYYRDYSLPIVTEGNSIQNSVLELSNLNSTLFQDFSLQNEEEFVKLALNLLYYETDNYYFKTEVTNEIYCYIEEVKGQFANLDNVWNSLPPNTYDCLSRYESYFGIINDYKVKYKSIEEVFFPKKSSILEYVLLNIMKETTNQLSMLVTNERRKWKILALSITFFLLTAIFFLVYSFPIVKICELPILLLQIILVLIFSCLSLEYYNYKDKGRGSQELILDNLYDKVYLSSLQDNLYASEVISFINSSFIGESNCSDELTELKLCLLQANIKNETVQAYIEQYFCECSTLDPQILSEEMIAKLTEDFNTLRQSLQQELLLDQAELKRLSTGCCYTLIFFSCLTLAYMILIYFSKVKIGDVKNWEADCWSIMFLSVFVILGIINPVISMSEHVKKKKDEEQLENLENVINEILLPNYLTNLCNDENSDLAAVIANQLLNDADYALVEKSLEFFNLSQEELLREEYNQCEADLEEIRQEAHVEPSPAYTRLSKLVFSSFEQLMDNAVERKIIALALSLAFLLFYLLLVIVYVFEEERLIFKERFMITEELLNHEYKNQEDIVNIIAEF